MSAAILGRPSLYLCIAYSTSNGNLGGIVLLESGSVAAPTATSAMDAGPPQGLSLVVKLWS